MDFMLGPVILPKKEGGLTKAPGDIGQSSTVRRLWVNAGPMNLTEPDHRLCTTGKKSQVPAHLRAHYHFAVAPPADPAMTAFARATTSGEAR